MKGEDMVGKIIERNGKRWRIASLHPNDGYPWFWLVNMDNKSDQVRLSVSAVLP